MEWFRGYASGIILYMAISIMTTIPHLCCTRTHQTRTLSLLNITHSTTLSILNAHLSQRKWSTTSNYNTICWIKSYLESLNQTLLQRDPDFLHQNVWPRSSSLLGWILYFRKLAKRVWRFSPFERLTIIPILMSPFHLQHPSHPNHGTLTLDGSHSSVLCAPTTTVAGPTQLHIIYCAP